jgi:uncharacterized protein with GYD domain
MPTFILSLNWTDQGIRGVKEAPKRSQAAKGLAKKLGVEIKQVYLTSGDDSNDAQSIISSARRAWPSTRLALATMIVLGPCGASGAA